MTDIPDDAVQAAAKAAWVIVNGLTEAQWDNPGNKADLKQQIIEEYEETLAAAAPIIRADERRRVIAEIQASNLGAPLYLEDDGTAHIASGPEMREILCAFIAERNGK